MATYISNQTGDWNSATTWLTAVSGLGPLSVAGQAPQSNGGDKIIIRGGHTVMYNVSGIFGDETSTYLAGTTTLQNISANGIILSGGTLKASRTTNTELTARGTIYIAPSSTLDWGTTVDPISNVNANITLHYMPQLSALSASPAAAGLYLHGGNAENQSFNNYIYINGRPRIVNTTLAVSAAAGSTVISVVSSTGWRINDRLIIATEYIGNITSTTAGILSSTTILSMTGNNITISTALNTAKSKGTSVGNFTSNVNIKSYDFRYPSYGIFVNNAVNSNLPVDINYIKLESMGVGVSTPVGWGSYSYTGTRPAAAQTGTPIGAITFSNTYAIIPPFTIKGVVVESFSSFLSYPIYVVGKLSETVTFDDCATYHPVGTTYGFYVNTQVTAAIKNSVVYRAVHPLFLGASVPNNIYVDNCSFDGSTSVMGASINGLTFSMTNSKLRSASYISALDAIQTANIKNSTIVHTSSAGAIFNPNVNASGKINFSNCSFLSGNSTSNPVNLASLIRRTDVSLINKTAQTAEFNILQPNGNLFDFRKFNYYHYSQSDLIVRKRGITSYKIKPEITNTPFYNYYTIPAVADTPLRIKGSLRFDSNYGITHPPSINFNGAGEDKTFTCTPTVDTWQDFDITLNPITTDDITMTVTCRSSATNGFVWLDGIPITPYIQNVRHYGFVFDKAIDRTVNTLNTLTENQVSALTTVSNLDYLYDSSTYWSVLNPSLTSYIDLVTVNGTVLDFGSKNIIINNTGTAFDYISSNNTIVLNAPNLSAGKNFNTLKTTGVITLSTGLISNIDINSNIVQNIPTNLTGIFMLSSSNTLTYNTNTPVEVEYTNCTMVGVQNSGNAVITIKRTNSTVTENDLEIVTYSPTLINLTLQNGYIGLYDNTNTRIYYQNTDATLVLPANATGNWSYKIARYGYQFITGTFTVNPNTGGTINIVPIYIPDTYITQNNVSVVSAYTDLNTPDKIHDYLSYYQTTSAGIDYGILESESFGVISFNTPLTIDPSASNMVDYIGSVLTLKASGIIGDMTLAVNGDLILSGAATVSDNIKVRANNLDSELYFNNINSITLYPTLIDRDNNTNPGITTNGSIYRYKYGSTYSGVTMSDNIYARITIDGVTLIYVSPILTGSTTLDLGVAGTLQSVIQNQKILNTGIQKSK